MSFGPPPYPEDLIECVFNINCNNGGGAVLGIISLVASIVNHFRK